MTSQTDDRRRSRVPDPSPEGGWENAFAVEFGGELDISSVYATERGAKVNWLIAGRGNSRRMVMLDADSDETISNTWRNSAEPQGARVVPIVISRAPALKVTVEALAAIIDPRAKSDERVSKALTKARSIITLIAGEPT